MKPTYIPPDDWELYDAPICFDALMSLPWLEVTDARKEYFMYSGSPIKYTYGTGPNARTYESQPFTLLVFAIMEHINTKYKKNYDVCFLNRYDSEHNQLGWHADDSPEMNHEHDIAVVSYGAEREIWWKEKSFKGIVPPENRQLLENGSLFVMPAGFQREHYHRIPRNNRACGIRISLTFRNYIQP